MKLRNIFKSWNGKKYFTTPPPVDLSDGRVQRFKNWKKRSLLGGDGSAAIIIIITLELRFLMAENWQRSLLMGVDDSQTIGEKFGLFITERLTGEKDCFNPHHHQGTYYTIQYSCVLTKKNHWSIIFPTDLEFYHTLKKNPTPPLFLKCLLIDFFFFFNTKY